MASLTKKLINGRPYYYLRETAWVEGRPKVVRTTYLGRAEDLERRLAEGPGEPKAVEVRGFGAAAAALRLARELGVAEAIDRALGARRGKGPSVGELIELAAINRACSPRSKRQLADWHRRTALGRLRPWPAKSLSSQRFWDAMDRLSDAAIRRAEGEIVRRAIERYQIELRPLVYDTTNFATFVDSANQRNTIARRGHAKGGRRDLRLVGLALCVALDGNLPLCHQPYAGNRNDASEFPEALALIRGRLSQLGLSDEQLGELTLVYDKGNNSRANQVLADELELSVVGSLVPSHHPELLAVPRSRFRPLEGIEGTSAYRTSHEVYGRERTVLVSHSQQFEQKQARSFAQTLAKARRELRELKGIVERGRHRMDERALGERIEQILGRRWLGEVMKVDFDLAARRLSFRTEQAALRRVRSREWGKRIIFTDRSQWTDEEIVAAYRSQAEAEGAFRQMKDPEFAAFSPAFHWTDQKLRVHAFYCTLALLIVNLIEREVRRAGIELGPKLALRLLSEIHETTLIYPPAGGKQGRPKLRTRLAEMDNTQRRLFEALQLSELAPNV
ncbi:MAG: IS1634 family transposase [Thermoleophilaceae bacterium]